MYASKVAALQQQTVNLLNELSSAKKHKYVQSVQSAGFVEGPHPQDMVGNQIECSTSDRPLISEVQVMDMNAEGTSVHHTVV